MGIEEVIQSIRQGDAAFQRATRIKARQQAHHENPVLAIRPAVESQIKAFEAELEKQNDPNLYLGVWLASFGQQQLIFVESIQFTEPCLIIFNGTNEEGLPLQLIQHVNQLNMLIEARKREIDQPRRPIGFMHDANA